MFANSKRVRLVANLNKKNKINMKNLKQKIIDESFNFEENNGTFKKSTIFLTDLFKILEKEQLILPIVSNQKELLIAFLKCYNNGEVTKFTLKEVDDFLKHNSNL